MNQENMRDVLVSLITEYTVRDVTTALAEVVGDKARQLRENNGREHDAIRLEVQAKRLRLAAQV